MAVSKSLLAAGVLLLANTAHGALRYKGADWSSVAVMERDGIEYKNMEGVVAPLETILAENGINIVRQRVWVASGDYDIDYNVALAQRAKAAGLDVHINLHYSDSWADPGQQRIPDGWPQDDLEGLRQTVYDYTLNVSNTLQDAGIQPAVMDIGNEIADGLLWPVGRGSGNWTNTALLLTSASDAIRASRLDPKPLVNVHLNGAADQGVQDFFWGNILEADPDFPSKFDIYSASFYPFYGPEWNFTMLTNTLTHMTTLLPGKEFLVSEMAWPFKCDQGGNFAFPPDMRPAIPFGAAGQATWVKEVAARVGAVPGGVGVEYWEAGWVQNAGLGQTGCEDNVMFEFAGDARESLAVFSEI